MTSSRSQSFKSTSLPTSRTRCCRNKSANKIWSRLSCLMLFRIISKLSPSKILSIIYNTNSNINNRSSHSWTRVPLTKAHFSEEAAWTPITRSLKTSILMPFPACLTCQIWRAILRIIINSNLIILLSAVDLMTSKHLIMTTWLNTTCLETKITSSTTEMITIIWKMMIIPWPPFNLENRINNRII